MQSDSYYLYIEGVTVRTDCPVVIPMQENQNIVTAEIVWLSFYEDGAWAHNTWNSGNDNANKNAAAYISENQKTLNPQTVILDLDKRRVLSIGIS